MYVLPSWRRPPAAALAATAVTAALSILLALAAPAAPAVAQVPDAAADPAAPLTLDPQVTTGTLPNGLRYYVRANRKPEDRAELRLVVNAGSILEDEDQRGLAHFVEHMAFNGTRRFEKQELVDYLESIGTRFGPDLNAYTSFDETVYMLKVPTDSAGMLETGLRILEDWAWGQTLDPAEIDRERGVVIEEWRAGRGASARMFDEQFPVLLRGSRYAERLPIGRKDVLESFEHDTLERFYREWYRPDLMAVVAVGDFDPARIEGLIREQFGRIPEAEDPRPRPVVEVPSHDETLFAIATDPEATASSISVYHKLPPEPVGTVGAYRDRVVERLFNGMLNERLRELTQRADPPFIGGYSAKGGLVRPVEAYFLSARVEEGGIERGLEALLTEAARVVRHGFTASELERQKAAQLRGMERGYAEREKTDSRVYASQYVAHFLEDEPVPGIEREYELYRQLLPGITLEEVNRLAAEWIGQGSRVVLVNAPETEAGAVPTEAALRAVMRQAEEERVAAYEDRTVDEPLLARVPEPAEIVAETRIPELDVTEWQLENGVRVVLKPTDLQDDQVVFRAFSPGGTATVPDEAYVSADLAANVAMMSGFGPFSMTDLQKKLAGKAVSVMPWIGAGEEGLSGSASPRDLETLFQLIHLTVTAPRVDSAAFQSFRSRLGAAIANRGASPEQVFGDTVSTTMAGHHFRARPPTPALLEELELETALEVYRDRFRDAGDFTFVFVGSFEPDTLRPLVRRYLGSLPAAGRQETRDPLDIDPPSGVIEKTVRKGSEPKAMARLFFTGPMEYSREREVELVGMVEVLRIRLRDVLREDMGGTYGVQVVGSASREPDEEYAVVVQFGTEPERVEELTEAVFDQIAKLKEEGPTAEEIAKVREIQRRGLEVSRERNQYWLSALASRYRTGEDPREILEAGSLIDEIDAAGVQQAARDFLRTDRFARFYLLPER